jgi:beta-1,4-mannosyl-glycoprotein beta-1,4-N-acetylglucosaminyltransferase
VSDIAGPRVYVCSPYYDEIDHLQAQFEILEYVVDGWIICEGDHTHQGDPKPLHLEGVDLPDTVIRCVADLGSYTEPWDREHAQRDYIGQVAREYLALMMMDPDDILVVADIDEILNPDVVKYLAHALDVAEGPVALAQRLFYYGLDWEDPQTWLHARALRVRDLPESLSALREGIVTKAVAGAGWHVSYTGGPERRAAKLRAYAHAEQNNPDTHALIATAHETGIGPNGEELVRVADLEGVPEALVRRFG